MKINKLLLLAIPLLITSCSSITSSSSNEGQTSSSADVIDPTSSSTNINSEPTSIEQPSITDPISEPSIDSSSSTYEYSVPTTLNNLYHAIYQNRYLEGSETSTASFTQVTESSYTTDTQITTYKENLTMYEGFSYTTGSKTILWKKSENTTTKAYTKYRGIVDNYFYLIVDYEDGKDNDSAVKYLITDRSNPSDDEISSSEVEFNESIIASYYALTYLNTAFNYVSQNKEISYVENIDNTLTFSTSYSYQSSDEYGSYIYKVNIDITIDKEDGFLKKVNQVLTQVNASDENDVANIITDTYIVNRGSKSSESITYEDPRNYWMSDYEIGFRYADPNKMGSYIDCDISKLPMNTYVYPYAKTCIPEIALDTELKSVISSDSNIISVSSTYFLTGSTKGSATVHVISESGISKSIDVTVGSADITSIKISLYKGSIDYRSNIFIGDELEIQYSIKPNGTLDDIVFSSTDPSVGDVEIKNGVPYFVAKSAGTVSITASVKGNSSVNATISDIVVLEDTSISKYLVGYSWKYLYSGDAFTSILTFKEDGTGVATLTGNNPGVVNFNWVDLGNLKFKITPYPYSVNKTYAYAICNLDGDYKRFTADYYDDNDDYVDMDSFIKQ